MQQGSHIPIRSHSSSFSKLKALFLLFLISAVTALGQTADLSDGVKQQIAAVLREKAARTPTQQKMDTQLIYGAKQLRDGFINKDVPRLKLSLKFEADQRVKVDIDAVVSADLLGAIRASGGEVINNFPDDHAIQALLPLDRMESLVARGDVRFIRPASVGEPNAGSVNSEGNVAHRSNQAQTTYGANGAGIKVGVLSDSIDNGQGAFAAAKASGDVPANLFVVPGQAGTGDGEGLAMCEIVHDLAPAAQLYYATANPSSAAMAANIRRLAAYGCRVIIDDYNYPEEPPFQDGVLSRAVSDVSAAGVLYFSCARNAGNKNDGTSSTWEGNFVDGGDASGLPEQQPGSRLHAFAPGVVTNEVTHIDHPHAELFWSDPLGHSNNDYDLYVLDFTNSFVKQMSINTQNGTQDAYENVAPLEDGDHIVIAKYSGAARFLHLDAGRTHLSVSTAGCVRGHNASGAPNAFSVAATSAENRTVPFVGGAANPVETFSSDGPRRMFFNPAGMPYTPGNFLASGGIVLQKPDIAAADGVKTTLPLNGGLNPFFGTSAAAPHAGAIAAQILSYRLGITPAQVRTALVTSRLDIEASGFDRDSGWGIVMAQAALKYIAGARADFNIDRKSDILWQSTSGARSVWLMNGTVHTSSASLGTVSTAWNIVGSGDFNRDGKPDILWQAANGARAIWIMNGTTHSNTVSLGTVSTAWNIVGSGDFNGDGKADILWQSTSGARSIWLMNGTTHTSSVNLGTVSTAWNIVGAGDFNGDGKPDILWQTTSGARAIWIMNGTTHTSSVSLGTVSTPWNIVGSGDYNSDGRSDILWQNNSTGARTIWLMNGTTHTSSVSLGTVSTAWNIRNY